jgi:hypothetical protein
VVARAWWPTNPAESGILPLSNSGYDDLVQFPPTEASVGYGPQVARFRAQTGAGGNCLAWTPQTAMTNDDELDLDDAPTGGNWWTDGTQECDPGYTTQRNVTMGPEQMPGELGEAIFYRDCSGEEQPGACSV